MSLHKLVHLAPIAALTFLPISRPESMDGVEGNIAQCIVCSAHCFDPKTVYTVEDVCVSNSLGLVRTILVDGYVDVSLWLSINDIFFKVS